MSTQPVTPAPGTFNPLMGWATNQINPTASSPVPRPSPALSIPTGAPGNPGNLENPNSNLKDMIRNAGLLGVMQGQQRNDLIPKFVNLMFGYGGNAGDFFQKLMDLGDPYYQQKQAEGFRAGVDENENAAAKARQQIAAQGYGATPSGATAATIGAMNVEGAKSLSQQFLEQLFQNENLQLGGAQGLAHLAALFNPSQLFGPTGPTGTTQGPSAAQNFKDIMQGIQSGFTAGSAGQ